MSPVATNVISLAPKMITLATKLVKLWSPDLHNYIIQVDMSCFLSTLPIT